MQRTFTGAKWFVEGDIKACFDDFDHHVLIDILRRRIDDEAFIALMWKFLKAGYMEQWEYHKTYSGTPQGSGISPILANIYLNELDRHITEYKATFDCGSSTKRKVNPESVSYTHLPSAFSFPQEVMDDVLRLGGNTDELRMRVVAEFEKRRSIDEIAAFLPTVYRGGNGFIIDGEKYAVWFSEDGIRVAQGEQARYERGAQLITWADAAARIGELLGDGRFATKEEVTGAEDYEHELIARKLRDLQHDLSKGNEGLFPNLADVDGGYPEAVRQIAAKLADCLLYTSRCV